MSIIVVNSEGIKSEPNQIFIPAPNPANVKEVYVGSKKVWPKEKWINIYTGETTFYAFSDEYSSFTPIGMYFDTALNNKIKKLRITLNVPKSYTYSQNKKYISNTEYELIKPYTSQNPHIFEFYPNSSLNNEDMLLELYPNNNKTVLWKLRFKYNIISSTSLYLFEFSQIGEEYNNIEVFTITSIEALI